MVIYTFICSAFLVLGVAVGINVSDKTVFVLNNNAVIFRLLRGDIGIFTFFFVDFSLNCLYGLFAVSMFFYRATTFLSLVPCAYRSYVLGMNVCIIISVYSVAGLPMLFVLYVPICLIEITVLCVLSFRCFSFYSLNCGCIPSRADIRLHYSTFFRFILIIAVCGLLKMTMLGLFGSSLVGII